MNYLHVQVVILIAQSGPLGVIHVKDGKHGMKEHLNVCSMRKEGSKTMKKKRPKWDLSLGEEFESSLPEVYTVGKDLLKRKRRR